MTKQQNTDYKQEPIAVIGMDCIFPKAPDVKTFWQNILNGVNAIGDPLPEWEAERYLNSGYISTKKGGYLRDLYRFNSNEFGIMPNSTDGGEPDQFLALQIAKRALADAGEQYLESDYNHTDTGIVLGHSPHLHRGQINGAQHFICLDQTLEILQILLPSMTDEQNDMVRKLLKNQLPVFSADTCPSMVPNVMTGRIANRLNFSGPNYLIDAACASSLLSINAAVDELRSGSSRMMLAGGVNASVPAEILVIFSFLDALSKKGNVTPFSSDSDGTLLGEGLGVVVLKRLSDALADGDRIYSLVHGVGQSSDGKGHSLLAPSESGETLAIKRAYEFSGIDPATISLIEAHGTGIALGDRTEIAALRNVFGEHLGEQGSIAIGSVKSMISHCIPAAGIASFIKMSLSLYHKVLPPTLCEKVNPALGIDKTAMYVNTAAMPWISKENEQCRAAINSFGFGGVNTHAILEEAPAEAQKPLKCSPWSVELFVFAADNIDGLKNQLDRLKVFLEHRDDADISDIAYTLSKKLKTKRGIYKLALIASDHADLIKKIEQAEKRLNKSDKPFMGKNGVVFSSKPVDGKIAFLFPGEGSQYMGMLSDLAIHFDEVREWFDFLHSIYDSKSGSNRTDIIFPKESELTDEKRESLEKQLYEMNVGSEAVFVAGQAMYELLTSLGVKHDVMVGHSSGESAALVASHAVQWNDRKQLAGFIRQLNSVANKVDADGKIVTGSLMAVALISRDIIEEHIKGTGIVIAMENCHTQTILFGDKKSVATLSDVLVKAGAICELLPFDRGYHTKYFKPMQEGFVGYYNDIALGVPKIPLYSCASAVLFPDDTTKVRELASRQWAAKVRFIDTIKTMYNDGVRYFIEVGPSGKLTSFVEQILREEGKSKECVIEASNLDSTSGLHQLLNVMAKLFVNGKVAVDKLFADRKVTLLDIDNLDKKKKVGIFLDNTLPRLHATDDLTELLQSIMPHQPVTSHAPKTTSEDPFPEYRPFFTEIAEVTETNFIGYSKLSVHDDNFLQDHILSGTVSEVDSDLKGLSCVPLMVSLEIMAEACAVPAKSIDLRIIEDIRTFNWIALDYGEIVLEVRATAVSDAPKCYFAEILVDGNKVVSARFSFADDPHQYVLSESLPALVVKDEPYRWSGDYEMYGEGMFHGSIFQTVRSITNWGDNGIDAELSRASLNGFFRGGETPKMIINPALFDSLNQLTAFWVAGQIGTDFNNFPASVERIEIYSDCPQNIDGLHSRARLQSSDNNSGAERWDFECMDSENQPLIRIKNLQNVFFEVPNEFYKCRHDPLNGWLGSPIDAPDDKDNLHWYLPYLPESFCAQSNGVFIRVLAHSLLSMGEREQWLSLNDTLEDKCNWLFSRACIKEAVRYWIYHKTGELLYPSDVIVHYDENNAPYVDGWWCSDEYYLISAPAVSYQGGQRESFAVIYDV